MKKKLNIVFFSLCFLGSVIAEAYFIQAGAGDLFSVIALGAVVLITGYLWMDSIRSKLSESGKEIKNYIDQMYLEETGRWNERLNELQNLQKATYTATKKNTATVSEQLEELIDRIETLEVNNAKALQRLADLQMKELEGQKKVLSLEINYNKENTRQLMKAIGESGNQTETIELLGRIAERLEYNTQVLQQEPILEVEEALGEQEAEEQQTQNQEIKPLYADANKALSTDEIAALFASFGQ